MIPKILLGSWGWFGPNLEYLGNKYIDYTKQKEDLGVGGMTGGKSWLQ